MKKNEGFQSLGNLFARLNTEKQRVKPPAYEWQDLALRIIAELGVPNFKRASVFKVCKNYSKEEIERALNDTKELCKTGNRWAYFFKVIEAQRQDHDKKNEVV
ncbi:MAG: hypothetical protein WCG01_02870 [bacterium]